MQWPRARHWEGRRKAEQGGSATSGSRGWVQLEFSSWGPQRCLSLYCTRLVEEMEVSEAEGADLFCLYAAVCSFKRTVKTLQLSYMPASRMILKQHLLNLGFQVLGMACPDHSCPLWILFIWPPAHKAGRRKTLL